MKKLLSKISISRLIFSIVFSIALFFMSKIVFLGGVYDNNYMKETYFCELKILIVVIPIIYTLLYCIEIFYNKVSKFIISKEEYRHRNAFCVISCMFFISIFMFYFLSFYPGGVFSDTWNAYIMIDGGEILSAHQPVLYTMLLLIVKIFEPNIVVGFSVFTFLQIVITIIILVYFIYWLLEKKINPRIVAIVVIFFGFFKLIPLYSVSIWKDTPFSLVMFLYILKFIDILDEIKAENIQFKNAVLFNTYGLLIMQLRNNGIFIILFTALILLVVYRKKFFKIKNFKELYILFICFFILEIIIQNLYYGAAGVRKTEFVESVGMPLQQIGRVVANDGSITDEQKAIINKIIPIDTMKKSYRAMIVDSIKWEKSFDNKYLEENKFVFLKLWLELLIQNPKEYLKAFFIENSGYWTFNVKGEEAYVSAITWDTVQDKVPNTDFTGCSRYLSNVIYYSGGLFFWIMAISMFITYRIGDKRSVLAYLPSFILWCTIMIATPMAQALRYVFVLVIIVPLNLIYPAMKIKK